jgi:hypothetical protein
MSIVITWLVYSQCTQTEEDQGAFYEYLAAEMINNTFDVGAVGTRMAISSAWQSVGSSITSAASSLSTGAAIDLHGGRGRSGVGVHLTPCKQYRRSSTEDLSKQRDEESAVFVVQNPPMCAPSSATRINFFVCMPRRTSDGFHRASPFSSFFSKMLSLPPSCWSTSGLGKIPSMPCRFALVTHCCSGPFQGQFGGLAIPLQKSLTNTTDMIVMSVGVCHSGLGCGGGDCWQWCLCQWGSVIPVLMVSASMRQTSSRVVCAATQK